jgi:hypothetical protein
MAYAHQPCDSSSALHRITRASVQRYLPAATRPPFPSEKSLLEEVWAGGYRILRDSVNWSWRELQKQPAAATMSLDS